MWATTERSRLSAVMYVRGFSALALGAAAVRWPAQGLWPTLVGAGVIVTLLGVVELILAMRSTAGRPVVRVLRAVAIVSLAFGPVAR